MNVQVTPGHYVTPGYLSHNRFTAFGHQVSEVLATQPKSVLEIGIGVGVVSHVLRKAGIQVTTLDFDASLEPDIVASVTAMPLADRSFDTVACFEVLEHIPYDQVSKALSEICRVCTSKAILSIPDARQAWLFRFPKVGSREFLIEQPFWRPPHHSFDGEHYWEINTYGHSLKDVLCKMTTAGFRVEHTFRPWSMSRHRLFRLVKL